VCKVTNASKGVNCEREEGDVVAKECLELGGVVDIGRVGEFPAQ
jgi:hypothetical protein